MVVDIPDVLRFPTPPDGGDRASDERVAAFVQSVLTWRDAVEHAIRKAPTTLPETLTGHAAALMLRVLTPRDRSPNLDPRLSYRTSDPLAKVEQFPAQVAKNRRSFVDLLRWRMRLTTFLHAEWDESEAGYNAEECYTLLCFLDPPGSASRCGSCLGAFPPSERQERDHRCPLHVWPKAAKATRRRTGPLTDVFRRLMTNHGDPNAIPAVPAAAMIGGGLLASVAMMLPRALPQGVMAIVGLMTMLAGGLVLALRRRGPSRP